MALRNPKLINILKFNNTARNSVRKRCPEKQLRCVTYSLEYTEQQVKPDWNRAVSDAEKIVGYPTSYLTLRSLLSDEISNLSVHIRKLIGTSHPLLKTAKRLIYNGRNNLQTRGLIILLISKAAGYVNSEHLEQEFTAGVLSSQRTLAEIAEMIHTAQLIHKAIVNISPKLCPDKLSHNDMTYGNKIAILSGDYLLANACTALASLNNSKVVELISSSISDFMEAEFIGQRDHQDNPLPSVDFTIQDWETKNVLSAGSLMANSCHGCVLMAGHGEEHQKRASEFGRYLALAWQSHNEIQPFLDICRYPPGTHFDLTSLPIVLHIQKDPHSILDFVKEANYDYEKCSFDKLHRLLVNDGAAVTEAMVRCHKYADTALNMLSDLEESDARTALQNLIFAMKEI